MRNGRAAERFCVRVQVVGEKVVAENVEQRRQYKEKSTQRGAHGKE